MSSFLTKRGNNALSVNNDAVSGQTADIALTVEGSDWYFAVCAVMAVSTLAFLGLGIRQPRSRRIFHYITAGITMVATIAYFSMGSHLGWAGIPVEFKHTGGKVGGTIREIYYVRYIDWVITTPLLLLDLLLTAGMPLPTILFAIGVDEVMIITGLIGALVSSSYKWAYFVMGCLALFYIGYALLWEGRKNAGRIGADVGKTFLLCGTWTTALWFIYPIAWGVCEGANIISVDGEAIFYGILDLLAKPCFGALLIFGHRNIDPARLGLKIHDYSDDDASYNGHHGKKEVPANTAAATNNTTGETV